MNRCNGEEFFFDVKENIYSVVVSDNFDTSQAMMLHDYFRCIYDGVAQVAAHKFNVTLADFFRYINVDIARYDEVKNIPIPCLILDTKDAYGKMLNDEYFDNIIMRFINDGGPAIYLGRDVTNHTSRKADATKLNSIIIPVELDGKKYYRFEDRSVFAFTHANAIIFMFNPFIPILLENEVGHKKGYRETCGCIKADTYAQYKKDIVSRMEKYSAFLNTCIDNMIEKMSECCITASIRMFLQSGYGMIVGTKDDFDTYKKTTIVPFESEDNAFRRLSMDEVMVLKNEKDTYKRRYAIAEKRFNVIKSLLDEKYRFGYTYLGIHNTRFEENFDEDNTQYMAWLNSNVPTIHTGWFKEKDLIDLINFEGRILTSYGAIVVWGNVLKEISNKKYVVKDIVVKEKGACKEDSIYVAKVANEIGKTTTYTIDELKELVYKCGYSVKKVTSEDITKKIKKNFFEKIFK